MNSILMVEDDIGLIDGLVFSLEKNGFETDVARTVREAEEKLRRKGYDLILLDVSLPDGNGFRSAKKSARIPKRRLFS